METEEYHQPANAQKLILSDKIGNALRNRISTIKQRRDTIKMNKDLYLSNYERLKFESVHTLVGRSFVPTVLGILNEDPYI